MQLRGDKRLVFLRDYLAERIAKVLRTSKAKLSADTR